MVVVVVWFWFWQGGQGGPDTPGTRYVDEAGLELQRLACLVLLDVGIKGMVTMPGLNKFLITLNNWLIVHRVFVLCCGVRAQFTVLVPSFRHGGPRD